MSEKDFREMNDAEFEAMLASGVDGQPPPEEVVELVSPWHKSVKRVLWGFALTLLNIQFLYLQYILPAIGFFMLIFGLRALRKENKFFGAAYVLAWARSIYFFSSLAINASAMHSDIYASNFMWGLTYFVVVLTLATVFCFALGFREVLRKTGGEDGAKWLCRLVVWYTIFAAAAVISIQSTLIALAFMVCFVFIVVGIARVSRNLSWAGYAITPAKVRVSDKQLCAAVLGTVALGIVLVYFFGAKYPMKWQAEETERSAETLAVMAELEALGFPSDVLADLTEEEILACKGAESVYVESGEAALNEGRRVKELVNKYGLEYYETKTVYDVKELVITDVAVNLDSKRVRVFHHFRFQAEAEYYGTEMLDVIPLYSRDFLKSGDVSGRVLYDDGATFVSTYYSLEEAGVQGWFSAEPHIRAAFSLPSGGENKRGYVTYEASAKSTAISYANAYVYYTHRTGEFIYPVVGTKDIPSSFFGQEGFKKITTIFGYERKTEE